MTVSQANGATPATEPSFPAHLLVGVTVEDGWEIVEKLTKPKAANEELTPGFFSVGYRAVKGKERAFLKAFDLEAAITMRNGNRKDPTTMMLAVADLSGAFLSENSLLEFCKNSNLDKIVKVLQVGYASPPPGVASAAPFPVPYLMFELADDGDIRNFILKTEIADDYWRLTHLHSVTVGLQQLHTNQICHQDLKPANVLIFKDNGAKIGDLGRASSKQAPAPHDNVSIPGDSRYAPPELSYGEVPTSWVDRREASDLYHLGSLMTYLFTGMSTNTLLYEQHLAPEFHFMNWHGRYADVLPHLEAAFAKVVAEVNPMFPVWAREDLTVMLQQMCAPDFTKRGAPESRRQANNPLGMERYVSRFDLLAKQAQVKIKKAS
ncbi:MULTISPECIES: protein kinase [unclassified Herbaspirillum]|uniref:protein kinase domain-containing protein n=1 Tax=unclassified Herbaspirillum TaxID=2624150 RepID=UPI001154198F|nr:MULTISPECIES: protein kinase [unclassified Herbaspirillum]MBB5392775.1 serine/threonine protein kinase [Herbaspirillum sp. SJZ102]TQK04577.1 protein kinase-like protein [Herbaspirillum sp. SJZ130]TQK09637.1 protein kinase-like protein [Herbaspirillum sp. SJZ106]